LALTSPFGTRLLEANWSAQSAILVLPEGQRSYPDMAALTQSTLGAPLPVSALFDWLEGRPMPNIPSVLTPEGFEQSGWRIDTHAKAQGRLTVQRQTPEPPMTLRVVLSEP
jgi:outer membrane lipoprotein LolB